MLSWCSREEGRLRDVGYRGQTVDNTEDIDQTIVSPCQHRKQKRCQGNDGHAHQKYPLASEAPCHPATRELRNDVPVKEGGHNTGLSTFVPVKLSNLEPIYPGYEPFKNWDSVRVELFCQFFSFRRY